MKQLLLSLILSCGLSAQAANLLTLSGGEKKLEGVTLNKSAVITGSESSISLIGAGLRSKTVLFVPTKVYVTELFSSEPQTFSRDAQALRSLENAKVTAIRMTFLRNVDAPTVSNSYKDALIANSVSLNEPAIAKFLNDVEQGGDAVTGKSLTILLIKTNEGGTNLYYEDTKGQQFSVAGDISLQQKVLSIWLGQPADAGLQTLKNSLLKPVY